MPGQRPAWYVRLLAAFPLRALHVLSAFLAWLAVRVVRYRMAVTLGNLKVAFPEFDERRLREVARDYYRGFGDVLVELFAASRMTPGEITRRVRIEGLEVLRERLAEGRPVLLVAAHQCNWEWMLLAMSVQLGYPLDAAYKPLVNPWAEREMKRIRTRFGARLVPAQSLLGHLIQERRTTRAIAMVADQEPVHSEEKHWTRFLNRDTAFYLGAEEIHRKFRYPAYFIHMRRTARGHYAMRFSLLADGGERLAPGEFTERYAARAEAQIRESPPDWLWSHKRWKLRRPVYGSRG